MCPPGQAADSSRTTATPDAGVQLPPRARPGAFSPSRPDPSRLASKQTSTDDVLAVAIQALEDRGITSPEQFADLGAEAILGTCRWFDAQKGRVGQGVLVMELKAGGKPGWQAKPRSMVDQQIDYGNQICDWLTQNFPELCDPKWGPHPASIAAVIRLHHSEGKGNLRKREHGPVIRKAVRDFNKRYEIKESKV